MPLATRTFRIFVSSTFSDMTEERNALHKFVFPRLRDLCTQHGCRFQAIDLRWGVREEAGLDQRTMQICLDEISRSQKVSRRPNFIALLGDRYGSRPLPAEIPEAEFRQLETAITDPKDRAMLDTWYKRDENALPAVYCLQPRKKNSEFADLNTWDQEVERPLRRALIAASERIGLNELTEGWHLKYGASATEQEISAGVFDIHDAPEQAFCYLRTIRNLPRDRSAKDFVDLDENDALDKAAAAELFDLIDRLKAHLADNVYHYESNWTGNTTVNIEPIYRSCQSVLNMLSKEIAGLTKENVTQLGTEVWENLSQFRHQTSEDSLSSDVDSGPGEIRSPITLDHLPGLCIDVYLALAKTILLDIFQQPQQDLVDREISDHDAFRKERSQFFVGRSSILKNILEYLTQEDRHPFAVWGESGSGKSALMAKAIADCRSKMANCEIVSRFIGVTPASSDGRSLLESICRQVTQIYDGDEATIPTEYKELVKELPQRLVLAKPKKPLVIFLDAVDQLSNAEGARNLMWLPSELPKHVRLVVSTLPGDCKAALERKLPPTNVVKLEAMLDEEGVELLDAWLDDAKRTLQPAQRDEILTKFSPFGLPLYLKLAFDEARRWKSYSPTVDLAADIPGIIRQLFDRLSLDTNHGEIVVRRSLGYLAAAKNGLSEDEILDVLSRDEDVLKDFKVRSKHTPPEQRLPVIVWSRLYFDLEPYLAERSADGASLQNFYHRQLREVAEQTFLTNKERQKRHAHLAEYFLSQELFEKEKRTPNIRKLSELPYQQTNGEQWKQLHQTLTDFDFLEAKCTYVAAITSGKGESARTVYNGVYELQQDYLRALDKFPSDG